MDVGDLGLGQGAFSESLVELRSNRLSSCLSNCFKFKFDSDADGSDLRRVFYEEEVVVDGVCLEVDSRDFPVHALFEFDMIQDVSDQLSNEHAVSLWKFVVVRVDFR